jgi:hypothetical protein
MDEDDDWPQKRHSASDVPPDDGRLGRATVLVYALAVIAIAAVVGFALVLR